MKKSLQAAMGLGLAGTMLFACSPKEAHEEEKVQAINLDNMDSTIRPQDDFFGFVNGEWIANTEIPADQGRWGSFNELREFNNEAVLTVLEEAKDDEQFSATTDQGKAVSFYQIGMDSLLAEKRGMDPVKPIFEKIEKITDKASLQDYLAYQQTHGGGAFFGLGVNTDLKDSEAMAQIGRAHV